MLLYHAKRGNARKRGFSLYINFLLYKYGIRSVRDIPTIILIISSEFYNVSVVYILGISNVR